MTLFGPDGFMVWWCFYVPMIVIVLGNAIACGYEHGKNSHDRKGGPKK